MSGKEDQIIPYTDSQATLEKFKALGGETKEVIYPGIGHIDFPSVLETQSDGQTGVVDEIKAWISKIRRRTSKMNKIVESDVTLSSML